MKVEFKNISGVTYSHLKNVASTDDLRPAMQGVNINLKESRLECTDAHLLMMYPIAIIEVSEEDKEKDSIIVPIRFFNHLRYMIDIDKKLIHHLQFFLLDEFAEVHFGGVLVYRCNYIDAKYPKIQAVLPDSTWERQVVQEIGLNLNIVEKMTKSFPREFPNNLKFSFYAQNKGVVVESLSENSPKVKGMIMPIMLNTTL